MKNLLFALLATVAIGFASCGGSDCDLVEFTTRADANLAIGQTYVADSTQANCEAYKADLESMISDYEGCDDAVISGQVTAFQQQLNGLPCN